MRWWPAVALAGLLTVSGLVVSRPLAWEWAETLPLTARPPVDRTVVMRAPGDTLQLYYQLWLVADGIWGPTPLFRDPYQFRVNGPTFNLPQTFLPLAIPFSLLSAPLGSHAAYNLLVVLSFPAAGLAAFALVRHYTGQALPAVVAGVGFALVAARLSPLFGGQPAGFAATLVPLVLWGLDLALTRASAAGGAVGGLAMLGLAMLEPHYTYLTGGIVMAYAIVRVLAVPAARVPARGPLLAFLGLATAGAGWLFMLRQAFLVGSVAEAGRSLAEVRLFSPGPAALLAPATYGSAVLLALALVGLVLAGRGARALALFYAAVLVAGVLLSLGPTVPRVPLYQALHRWLPLFALIRNPEKLRLLTSLGVVVLAGFGVRALLAHHSPRAARWLGLVALVAVILDTAPWHSIAVTRFPPTPVYATLRRDARRVLYLPLWPGDSAWSSVALYDVTRTRVPMLNGYSPLAPRRYVAEVFEPLQGLNAGDLGPAEYAVLRRLGVTHLVLDRAVFLPQVSPFPSAFTRDRLRSSPALALDRAADPLWLYRLTDEPPRNGPPATSPVGQFFEAEALLHDTGAVVDDRDASGARGVVARSGAARPGFLTFGPYRMLPAGAYRALFRVRGSGLTVEVTTDEGRRVLARRALEPRAAWDEAELPFEVDRARPLEYRVRWNGIGDGAVDWVLVTFADRPQPEWTFEVEDLPHKLGERPDPAASGGFAGYADRGESLRTDLVSGPARLYPAGRYRLTLHARTDGITRGPVLRLTVTEPQGRLLAARTVDAGELPPDHYRAVGLDFQLERPTVVEFPVGYLGGTGVYFDRIEVSPSPQ